MSSVVMLTYNEITKKMHNTIQVTWKLHCKIVKQIPGVITNISSCALKEKCEAHTHAGFISQFLKMHKKYKRYALVYGR